VLAVEELYLYLVTTSWGQAIATSLQLVGTAPTTTAQGQEEW